jgi:DNA-binding LacI/PurR family transcriptional regulator
VRHPYSAARLGRIDRTWKAIGRGLLKSVRSPPVAQHGPAIRDPSLELTERSAIVYDLRRVRKQLETPPLVAAPTVKDVAQLAGVSTATVSRVLSDIGGVRSELARRVRGAARKLGYQPNSAARNLRVRSTRALGMVFPDIENPFYASVIAGAEEVLQNAGYSLLLANYGEDPAREHTQLTSLRAERVAGILFAASCKPSVDYQSVLDAGIALVAVSRIPDGLNVDFVTVSNQEGARHAIEHLLRLGHRRIAFIDGAVSLSTTRERRAGYEQALRNAGLPVPQELIMYADFFHQAGGYEAVSKLLNTPKKPTAILVVSNNMALGVLQALQEREIDVPRDVAVVGFGDTPSAALLRPPLTVIAQPAREIGAAGARLLLERLQHPDRPRRSIVLDTQLIVRESCGSKSPGGSKSPNIRQVRGTRERRIATVR